MDREHEKWTESVMRWRGIDAPCVRCGGSGGRLYGSGATWRGGMGVAAMTWAVCDSCWGSGDAFRAWTDLRKLEASEATRIEQRAASLLAHSIGAYLTSLRPAIREVADELDKLTRSRKPRAQWFHSTCEQLAKTLRAMAQEPTP